MKIVVNDIAASEGGALTVLQEFYEEIRSSNDSNEWVFLLNDYYLEETGNIKIKLFSEVKNSWFKRLKFELFQGGKIINQLKPDIYFSLQNTATFGINTKQIVYLHQPLPYQNEKNFSFFKKDESKLAIYQKVMGRLYDYMFKKTDAKIIVQTEWMKRAVSKRVNNEIKIVPPRVKIPAQLPNRLKKKEKVTFFYPASELQYKNHKVIFSAVNNLVQKGYTNFQVVLTIPPRKISNPEMYHFIGQITRDKVFEYYANSILLFPSYIETYGLPLKEATFFNAPIIASKTAFSMEILKDYGHVVFFNKYDSDELANLMFFYLLSTNKMPNKVVNESLKDAQKTTLLNAITNNEK
ncbi:glycosyltransferase [Tetragenococcus koreensis]|uniref:Glycosyltransferase n=1 Tax=Tetragenococcus halophilus TaxID=51669 RepID=A0AB35HQQ9_TETHA|nr:MULTISPECIES: glycosyltransferase [Tetragenococcus]MCF1619990.1 glycosyltransferase [Tetragenococcus koreensis]MCF1657471.1 glycosyltransferase [Tetragenococcus koreensis]MCO8298518.1 glycosyltransferase [Tetragenococcus halophilus]